MITIACSACRLVSDGSEETIGRYHISCRDGAGRWERVVLSDDERFFKACADRECIPFYTTRSLPDA